MFFDQFNHQRTCRRRMDFPLVDLSKGDIDGQAEPLDELKPLKWSAVEVIRCFSSSFFYAQ